MQSKLFSPIRIGELELPNRIVMAPLTRNRAGPGNVPNALNAEYYRQRAGAGLIISEASQVSPQGVGYPATPGIHNEAQVAGWKGVLKAVHGAGGRIFIQLWHVGRISHSSLQPDGAAPVAPSAVRPEGEAVTYAGMKPFETPRALETDELPGIVEQYRDAARLAREAGFDGVEIHAANGYLLDQFLRDGSNRRTDDYGGSAANRYRLLGEVLDAVLESWPAGRVGVRLSPENSFNDIRDSDPQTTFNHVVGQLAPHGLAYLHVIEGDMMTGARELDYGAFKQRFNGPYMANNGFDFNRANQWLDQGRADLIAFGKLYLANPDLVERFRRGAPLNEPDPDTFYGGDTRGYTDYPALEEKVPL
ncbi:alkene reductase [Thiohalobacter thiocyanaticus]|uniref:Alkene reductase n=1 Tax=Thiohalobacter thiocyanaticus TaxID=585455 RepID=A0A426QIH0_9GAMM|nr:alkene reductase [Thiohalobacter thiocyanaticus]RRQ21537.1 alkene reductase [Thiohalobacter thiocyanaticus]